MVKSATSYAVGVPRARLWRHASPCALDRRLAAGGGRRPSRVSINAIDESTGPETLYTALRSPAARLSARRLLADQCTKFVVDMVCEGAGEGAPTGSADMELPLASWGRGELQRVGARRRALPRPHHPCRLPAARDGQRHRSLPPHATR
eukprot:3638763-Prymnesium_polylepis.1